MQQDQLVNIDDVQVPDGILKIPFYKVPTDYEIAYALFEACNLHCKFCFEAHRNNKVDLDKIKNAPYEILQAAKDDFIKYPSIKTLNVRLWGGELFFDALKDQVFDAYKDLVKLTRELFAENFPEVKVRFSWLTNGVWTNWQRVKDILDYSQGVLGFSYDPADRFSTEKQKNLMIENVKRFVDLGYTANLSITLTKQTIKAYIENDNDFDQFPKGIKYDINYYTANPGWENLVVEDDDLYCFFVWAVNKRLFDINVIENLFAAPTNNPAIFNGHYCDCKTCKQHSNGYTTVDCAKRASVLPHEMFYGKFAKDVTEDNVSEIKLSLGIQKYNCLTCEFNPLCQKPCWITVVFEGYKPTDCAFRRIYKYLQDNPQIVQDFYQWRKLNGKD